MLPNSLVKLPVLMAMLNLALLTAAGCQEKTGSKQTGGQAAKSQQVTVDVTGMS